MARWVKELVLLLLWCRFTLWPGNFPKPLEWQRKKRQNKDIFQQTKLEIVTNKHIQKETLTSALQSEKKILEGNLKDKKEKVTKKVNMWNNINEY